MRFETDNGFHFDYFLADRLGCTVEELRRRMSQEEWSNWAVFHGRRAQAKQLAARGR